MGERFQIAPLENYSVESRPTIAVLGSDRVTGPAARLCVDHALNSDHVMASGATASEIRQTLEDTGAEASPALLTIIEISRAECLCHEGRYYSRRDIRDRFLAQLADPRIRAGYFRSIATLPAAQINNYVEQLPRYADLPPEDAAVLHQLRPHTATEASLENDIAAIAAMAPGCLFVSHFAAHREDGTPLRARRNFIRLLTSVLRRMRLPFFDPSTYVDAFGQARALNPDDRSLSSYSAEFEAFIAKQWAAQHLDGLRRATAPPKPNLQTPPPRPTSEPRPQPRYLGMPYNCAVA